MGNSVRPAHLGVGFVGLFLKRSVALSTNPQCTSHMIGGGKKQVCHGVGLCIALIYFIVVDILKTKWNNSLAQITDASYPTATSETQPLTPHSEVPTDIQGPPTGFPELREAEGVPVPVSSFPIHLPL